MPKVFRATLGVAAFSTFVGIFSHIFGDNDTPANDTLNVKALGFEPLANLASDNSLNLDESALSEGLSPENYQKLTKAISGLGHVGEGHCAVIGNQS